MYSYILFAAHRIRLVDGPNPRTGRVEVYTNSAGGLDNGRWGAICSSSWNIRNARVVCRQLGYPDAVAAPLSARYGQRTVPVWLDNVQCLGNERDLFTCEHSGIGYHMHSCENNREASVECLGTYTHVHVFS